MKNNNKNQLIKALTLSITLIVILIGLMMIPAEDAEISKEQVITDISYLADDKLAGRANFSDGIDTAADYISMRFKDIGLSPIEGSSTFKQTFSIFSVKPEKIDMTLNGNNISTDHLAIASTLESLNWLNKDKFETTVISKDDDMRAKLRAVNQQGGTNLLLISTAHAEWFTKYQRFFNRGITKLSLETQGTMVLVLTDETLVDSINLTAINTISKKSLTNVVGILKGHKKAEEIILYSAHYDHLGTKDADGDSIYNGADDDASGTTAVINLASYFTQQAKTSGNARTLMFSAFTAEEIGGYGSRYFSEQLNPDNVTAMINIEMIGKPSKFGAGTIWMTGMERSTLGELMNVQLAKNKEQVYEDPYPEQGLFYRSDNATLARLGVPAHSFSSTQLDKDEHYHKVTDDIASLDLESMFQAIKMISRATQGLVNGTDSPTRIDTSKVRSKGKIY